MERNIANEILKYRDEKNKIKKIIEGLKNEQKIYGDRLISFAKEGSLEGIMECLDLGAVFKNCSSSALKNASKNNHTNIVKYLIENGADIHTCWDCPLRYSAERGDIEMVKYLIEKGANIHADENCSLKCSAQNGHLEVVKYLVEKGANIHDRGGFIISWCAANGHLEVVKYLVEKDANIHANGGYALECGAKSGHLEVVKYLIENGANINRHALGGCAENGHFEVVKYLIECGVDIHANDDNALRCSAKNGHLVIVEFIISLIIKSKYEFRISDETFLPYCVKNGIIYNNSGDEKMQMEYDRRTELKRNLKEEIFTAAHELLMKPGGLRMKLVANEFGKEVKTEAYRYMD